MDNKQDWLQMMTVELSAAQIIATNRYSEKFGLTLEQKDVELLLQERKHTLVEEKRIEFGKSILTSIIFEFCDSAYINQDDYVQTLIRLQEIFFCYKNRTMDQVPDDELLHFMREQFEKRCHGDLDFLEGTCLDQYAQAIRTGSRRPV